MNKAVSTARPFSFRSRAEFVGEKWSKNAELNRFPLCRSTRFDRLRGGDFSQVQNARSSFSVQCSVRASSRTRTQHRGTRTRSDFLSQSGPLVFKLPRTAAIAVRVRLTVKRSIWMRSNDVLEVVQGRRIRCRGSRSD